VLPERERTVQYLKSKLQLKRTESVTQTSNDTSNVFKADIKLSFNCFVCGKPGHLRRDCKATGNVNRGRGFSYYQSHGTYNNRGRGQGHYNRQKSQGNCFHITAANDTMCENNKPKKGQIEWVLDSGCTDHIINYNEYFDSCETLTLHRSQLI
jgi:Zinc knuckle.